jgi:hypothetical protein
MAATLVTARTVSALQTALNTALAADTTQQIYSIDFVAGDQTTLQGVEMAVALDTVTGGTDLGVDPYLVEIFTAESPEDLEDLIDTWVATAAPAFVRGPFIAYLPKRRRLKDYFAIMIYSDSANALDDWFVDATGAAAGGVTSFEGRTGAVTSQAGDYDVSEITNAAALNAAQTFTAGQRGEVTALVDGANISINLDDSNNFEVTLAGNRQLDFPVPAPTAGQSGFITVTQDGTGTRTLSYEAGYTFAGGVAPVLSTDPGAKDLLTYYVISAAEVEIALAQADIS